MPKSDSVSTTPSKLSIPLTDSGEIDWERVRPAMRETLLNTVNNDVIILEHIGFSHESGTITEDADAPDLGITMANVRTAIDMFGAVNALVFEIAVPKMVKHTIIRSRDGKPVPLKIDRDICLQSFTLTEEQHKEFDPRVMRMLKKAEMPEWMKKHLDTILLIGMYAQYTASNAKQAIQNQLARDLNKIKDELRKRAKSAGRAPDSDFKPPVNGHAVPPVESGVESLDSEAARGFQAPPEASAP